MDMELDILDMEERYATLTTPNYNLIAPPDEELARVAALLPDWQALLAE